ncbi:MAG: DUF1230 domain-containing protein, partial [Synechococcaceae bacterium WBB_34_004]|nr:DUF1230 domain-containing protein [Synechococcaceae bacterium WBB_34_004]
AQHQVKPILARLIRATLMVAALLLFGSSICQAF